MMDEYINRTKLIEDIKSRFCKDCNPGSGNMRCRNCEVSSAFREIYGAPKAEVEEVDHGYWKFINLAANYLEAPFGDTCHCSLCGFHIDVSDTHFKYCPECGARMDGNNLVKEMEGNDNA